MKTVKVGIVGLGVVGTGTLKILLNERKSIHDKTNVWIDVKKACDININRDLGFEFDKNILTTNYKEIIEDPEISIVVELIGGYGIAREVIMNAIRAKKNVVTANKALVAKYSKEIFAEAKANGVKVFYEASVGGGIPIITPLQESLAANNIKSLKGIVNGTANYILTQMTEKGLDFKDVLKKAQELGYAEADPTFDIEGIDSAHKITILASLAYGGYIDFDKVHVEGITKITKEDIKFAQEFGYNIKLLASADRNENGIDIRVQPTLIEKSELLASVNDVFNAIEVTGDYVGKTLFYGRGAGMLPTGSAVAADIIKLASEDKRHKGDYHYNIENELKLRDTNEAVSKYYVRLSVTDKTGMLAFIAEKFAANGVSVESMIQLPKKDGEENIVSLIFITHDIVEKNLKQAIFQIGENSDIKLDNSICLKINK